MNPEVSIGEDEELHELFDGRLKIIQKKEGYRFSIDAILLAHFTSQLSAESIIDLGTGSGVIPLILARKMSASSIVGVEVQKEMADMAKRTILLNGFDDRVSILHGDLRDVSAHFAPSSFDLVVSNPPYYAVKDGRINPNQQKAIARHEIMGALKDTIKASEFLVKPSGLVVVIFPARRAVDLLSALRESGIEPKFHKTVYIHKREQGKFVIVKSCKGGEPELVVEDPFFVYEDGDNYSKEMQKIYDEI